MKRTKIGLLTEDQTDAMAIAILIERIAKEAGVPLPDIKKYPSGGCGHMLRKASFAMRDMHYEGCRAAIIVRDLDRNPRNNQPNDEAQIRAPFENISVPRGLERHICIPIEEIEAWFWSDENTVKHATRNNDRAHAHASPHLIVRPKELFERYSRATNGKPRYNPNENKALAEILNLALCEKRCPAFRSLADFIRNLVA